MRPKNQTHTRYRSVPISGLRTSFLFLSISLSLSLVVVASLVHAEYAVLYRKNGDRYTGIWRGGNERESVVELSDGQRIRIPTSEIMHILMTDNTADLPGAAAQENFVRGQQFLELGMSDEAESAFRQAVHQSPRFADAHFALAKLLEDKGLVEAAMRSYSLAVQIAPQRFQIADRFKALAEHYLDAGEYLTAAQVLLTVAQRFPMDPAAVEAAYRAGFLFTEQYELKQREIKAGMDEATSETLQATDSLVSNAIEALQQGLRDYPEHPDAERAHYLIGWLHYEKGLYPFAYQQLTQFIDERPLSPWIAHAYLARGRSALAQRLNHDALADFERALSLTTDGAIAAEARDLRNESAWQTYYAVDGLPSNLIQALAMDGDVLWVGTPKGLAKFDTVLGGWVPLPAELQLSRSINVNAIAVDEKSIWVGTLNNGLYRYDRILQQIDDQFFVGERVYDIEIFGDEVWIGTFNGLRHYDTATGVWQRFEAGPPAKDIVAVAVTPSRVWAGTSQSGIGVYDKMTRQWQILNRANGLPAPIGNSIRSLTADGDSVWFTWYTGNLNGWAYYDPIQNSVHGEFVLSGNMDPLEGILVGVVDQQAWIAHHLSVDIQDLLSSNWSFVAKPHTLGEITAMALNSNSVWIGTTTGLGKIDTVIAARASEGQGAP